MSATDLRTVAMRAIADEANQEAIYLVTRSEDQVDAMRFRQGLIHGLQRAVELIDEAYAKVGG